MVTIELSGVDLDRANKIRKIRWTNPTEALQLVTDKMIDEFAVAGNTSDIISSLNKLKEKGMTQAIIGEPFGPDLKEALKLIEREIIPSF